VSSGEVPLFNLTFIRLHLWFLDFWIWWWRFVVMLRNYINPEALGSRFCCLITDVGGNDWCTGWIIKLNSGCTMWCFQSISSLKFSESWLQKQLVQLRSCVPNSVTDHYEASVLFSLCLHIRPIPREHLWKSSPYDCSTISSFLQLYAQRLILLRGLPHIMAINWSLSIQPSRMHFDYI
jgi:hypothetical protein